jgi:alanyl-tRNA synthetase
VTWRKPSPRDVPLAPPEVDRIRSKRSWWRAATGPCGDMIHIAEYRRARSMHRAADDATGIMAHKCDKCLSEG